MDDVQFFLHIYDVGKALELAGVKTIKTSRPLVGRGVAPFSKDEGKYDNAGMYDMQLGGVRTMTKKEIDRFLEGEAARKIEELAERVFNTQRGVFRSSKKNPKYKVFKRPVIVSVAINGRLVSADYKVLSETGLARKWVGENKRQVEVMKDAIKRAHNEIANARKESK